MSREIKFRAWDKERNAMMQVNEITFDMQFECGWSFMTPYPFDNWNQQVPRHWKYENFGPELEPVILMQYTGLKDKNGKEIYENDVVKADGKNGIVQWNVSEPFYWVRFGENKFNYLWDVIDIEIIGNIYENSDLLN